MCFIFTCGEKTFRKEVEGHEGQICQCHNCGNYSGRVIKSNPWFTFCFIPVIPLSMKGYEEISCDICRFAQPLANRPDVQGGASQTPGGHPGGGMPMHPPQGHPQQGRYPPQQGQYPPQQGGWQGHPPPQGQQPGQQQAMRYG